ncbi:MAG: zinc ABC transporter substrate-binding protein [Deltaproteobacteria bacterium]|nr:zinc ABC transporter substrate-binding protein [Deltaproteobacteria bacterium]
MKNKIALILVCLGFLGLWLGLKAPVKAAAAGPRLIVASYPAWLFTRYLTMGRDYFQVELLTNPTTGCPHDFAPQPRDLERLSQARVLVKNGLGLEAYLERALKVASKDIVIIDASQNLPTLPGSWGRMDLGDGTVKSSDLTPLAPNPHIFSSPRLAGLMAKNIADGLAKIDPEGAAHYQDRRTAFQADMDYLNDFIAAFSRSRQGYKLIASHDFMDYLAQDLGLVILADIEPAPETAPSAFRLAALAALAKEEGVKAIVAEPAFNLNLARTLAGEAGVAAAVIDPVTAGPFDPGPDYYKTVMRENLVTLATLLPANRSANQP